MTSKKIFSLARELCLKYANSKHTMLPPPNDDMADTERSSELKFPSEEESVDMGWDLGSEDAETEFPDALTEFPEGSSRWKVDHSAEDFPETERSPLAPTLSPDDDVYLSDPKTLFPNSVVVEAAKKLCKKYTKLGR